MMKSYLILVLSLAFSSISSAQEVVLGDNTPIRNEYLRQELLEMSRAEEKATDRYLEAMVNTGVLLEEDVSLTTIQTLIVGFHALNEYCLERQLSQRLTEIVDEFGWPGKSLVGNDGAAAAVRLIEIADHDRELQKKCLALMKKARIGEVSLLGIAFLNDELLVAEGKKQRYGTQYNEDMVLEPIEDIEGLDARRKWLHLPPLALQADILQQAFHEIEAETGFNLNKCSQQENSD